MIRANSEEQVWDPQGSLAHIGLGGNLLAKEAQLSAQGCLGWGGGEDRGWEKTVQAPQGSPSVDISCELLQAVFLHPLGFGFLICGIKTFYITGLASQVVQW